ncbi:regulatory protein TetR [Coriobacterium glomerans PW2]|uniref:Regulatory protein TetR n=1 Tax=Coriobacterium glomerans (strain ATCC 49209 / DSM 20642 / JCM 10262 / PW2) TaxID=700015 RepID=F2NA87_CORGP|nr:TetR/AcrR family transcriptional regulator [Coriobacterium glomerans]AEB06273.1 regulatory protein TetR [Coriobacterium glomerans PW2]
MTGDRSTARPRERHTREDRREEILHAVRRTCSERGISRLSVSGVAKRVGCTRSLFYHYFPTKEAALEAALEAAIDDFIEQVRIWDHDRERGDIEGALNDVSGLLKSMVLGARDLPRSISLTDDVTLYTDFVDRIADRVASYICSSTVVDFSRYHEIRIDHIHETLYVLIVGLIMYIRTHPDASEELIRDIIASTLHIERFTAKYTGSALSHGDAGERSAEDRSLVGMPVAHPRDGGLEKGVCDVVPSLR